MVNIQQLLQYREHQLWKNNDDGGGSSTVIAVLSLLLCQLLVLIVDEHDIMSRVEITTSLGTKYSLKNCDHYLWHSELMSHCDRIVIELRQQE